jgi:hypothetical protein
MRCGGRWKNKGNRFDAKVATFRYVTPGQPQLQLQVSPLRITKTRA